MTFPDCIKPKDLVIYDPTSKHKDKLVEYRKYSVYDYVFKLNQGFNIITLVNLTNLNSKCLRDSKRLSFEIRTYADENLEFIK